MNKAFNLLFYVKKTKINAAGEVNNSILSIPIFLQNILGYKFNKKKTLPKKCLLKVVVQKYYFLINGADSTFPFLSVNFNT